MLLKYVFFSLRRTDHTKVLQHKIVSIYQTQEVEAPKKDATVPAELIALHDVDRLARSRLAPRRSTEGQGYQYWGYMIQPETVSVSQDLDY